MSRVNPTEFGLATGESGTAYPPAVAQAFLRARKSWNREALGAVSPRSRQDRGSWQPFLEPAHEAQRYGQKRVFIMTARGEGQLSLWPNIQYFYRGLE